MFEQMFKNMQLSAIGAKVVDDTEDFTIPVAVVPEGKAVIVDIVSPSSFTPNVEFKINVRMRNDGGADYLYVKLIDTDTGSVLKDFTSLFKVEPGAADHDWRWEQSMNVTLPQITDFHGRIEAGHIE